jgi:hypothetical protein
MSRPGLAASNYILNIVELQNTITSASGLTPFNVLSNQVAQIQQMVNYEQKQVNANVLSAFDTGGTIQVISPINLSNVTLSVDGIVGGAGGGVATLGTTSTSLIVSDGAAALTFNQAAQGLPSSFVIYSTGNAAFASSVTAAAFITASDERLKMNLRRVTDYETILSQVTGYRYQWRDTLVPDIGIIAQDVSEVLPEAVSMQPSGHLAVAYDKLVPVLVEAVKALQRRVTALEALTGETKTPKSGC